MIRHIFYWLSSLLLLLSAVAQAESDTKVNVGGYIKADYNISSYNRGDGNSGLGFEDFTVATFIPVTGEPTSRKTFHAKETRLWVASHTPTRCGPAKTYAEMDFLTNPGSAGDGTAVAAGYYNQDTLVNNTHARVLAAYGEWNRFLIGQNYSTFMDLRAYPELGEIGVPVGYSFIIQPMIRYTHPFSHSNLQIALENPDSTVKQQGAGEGTALVGDQRKGTPDFFLRYNHDSGLTGMLVVRQLTAGPDSKGENGQRTNKWSKILSLSGNFDLGSKDNIKFTAHYGNMGRYIGQGLFRDAVLAGGTVGSQQGPNTFQYPAEGTKIVPINAWAGFVGYRHHWTDNLRNNLILGYAKASNRDEEHAQQADRKYKSLHLNMMWNPIQALRLGVEYVHMVHEQRDDDRSGHMDRLSLTAKWFFA